jgi:hypothetical protein
VIEGRAQAAEATDSTDTGVFGVFGVCAVSGVLGVLGVFGVFGVAAVGGVCGVFGLGSDTGEIGDGADWTDAEAPASGLARIRRGCSVAGTEASRESADSWIGVRGGTGADTSFSFAVFARSMPSTGPGWEALLGSTKPPMPRPATAPPATRAFQFIVIVVLLRVVAGETPMCTGSSWSMSSTVPVVREAAVTRE